MNKLHALTRETASEKSKQIFQGIEKTVGRLMGNSANALSSYLNFSESQRSGSFNSKEIEAVALAVSEENGCSYCTSAHTAIAKMNGFSQEETFQLRAGIHTDEKLNVLTNLSKSIVANRGKADETLVNEFYAAAYDETALVDLVALVIDKTFTNYIGRLAKPEIDFPVAHPLNNELAA